MRCTLMLTSGEQLTRKKALPPIPATPEELRALIKRQHDGQQRQRLQALYLVQTQQARTRQQVARLLGGHRHTVGHWLAAYERGGVRQLLTLAKAPGTVARVPPAVREALQARFAQPQGLASYQAIRAWLQQAHGLDVAYNAAHTLVRYTLRAKLKVPRNSPRKRRCAGGRLSSAGCPARAEPPDRKAGGLAHRVRAVSPHLL